MKIKYIALAFALGLMAIGCAKKETDEFSHHHDHEHEHHGHEHHGNVHDEEGEEDGTITLSPAVAERFGLKVAKAEPHEFNSVVKAGGVVETSTEGSGVVAAPTAGIITLAGGIEAGRSVAKGAVVATVKADGLSGGDANRLAKVELDAAQADFDRLEALYADRLVTLSEYSAARAALERAKAAYSTQAASGRAASPITGVILEIMAPSGSFVNVGDPIARIAAADRLIVKAQVPINSFRSVASAKDARLILDDGRQCLLSSIGGRRIDSPSPAGSAGGYVPVSFSVINDGTLIPGQSVELYIIGESSGHSMAVPAKAIVEKQGAFFVYEQLDEDCYRIIPVETGKSDGEFIEITSGLNGGENIVIEGVTAVRLAETSGTVPEGHSHSH